ncbi:ABC transporter permease [Chromobacterium alticapitis]|nr:ABC transporter permease [Chromobacterium alticapitis]
MTMMRWEDFRVGWRWLLKEPGWSALVIGGLAIGFACCALLLGYVNYSMEFDRHIAGRERVYQLKVRPNMDGVRNQWQQETPVIAGQILREHGVAQRVSMAFGFKAPVRVGGQVANRWVSLVDPDYAQLFEVKTLAGDLQRALTRPDSAALTDEEAMAMFGTRQALGKRFTVGGKALTVAAIVAAPPATATQRYAILGGRSSRMAPDFLHEQFFSSWFSWGASLYFQPKPGHDAAEAGPLLSQALKQSPSYRDPSLQAIQAKMGGRDLLDFSAVKLADVYLDADLDQSADPDRHGNRLMLWGCAGIGLLILLLAAINYVNLATVRAIRRQREIGVRKVLGAGVGRVAGQFVAESILVALAAAALGLLLAWLLLPAFAFLVQRELAGIIGWQGGLLTLAAAAQVGALSGLYPAWVAAGVRATQALAGRDQQETRQGVWLRRGLTVAQFGIAMGLVGVTLAVAWQTWHGARLPAGFPRDGLLFVAAGDVNARDLQQRQALRAALLRQPGVQALSYGDGLPAGENNNSNNFRLAGGAFQNMRYRMVDCGFLQTYRLPLLAGRSAAVCDANGTAAGGEGLIISESAAHRLGFASPQQAVGRVVESDMFDGGKKAISAVVADIAEQTSRERAIPMLYFSIGPKNRYANTLAIRYQGSETAMRQALAGLWPRFFPDYPLQPISAKQQLDKRYGQDIRAAQLLAIASAIAMLIAAFGIYVLSAYSVQRMAREVVLRKLYGADGLAIARLIGREFALVLAASALLALPPAWLFIRHYLDGFVARAPIGGWTLLLALALCLLAVWRHLLAALRLRPEMALRG